MKVSNKVPGSPSSVKNAEASSKAAQAAGADSLLDTKKTRSASEMDSAKVDVSSRAQDMRRAKELATPSDGIDEAKVARLQKLIDSGEYKINAEAIADRLVDEQMKMPS